MSSDGGWVRIEECMPRKAERERPIKQCIHITKHELTHCDVVEPVEWFVSCSDTHCHLMVYLSTLKRLEEIIKTVLFDKSFTLLRLDAHIVECGEPLVTVGMVL